jgi:4-hydroxy-3-polyprenylbenzoate decarboxylase
LLPEGPFGDHLGYYSLAHDFPVLRVDRVYHRPGAIWPFTTVGRPPQEDTTFGAFIHELTAPLIPAVLPGVHAVHAVDAAGVHPLLLAIGEERYLPYAAERKPRELLTQASAILGQGQLSLAKFLFIIARQDDPTLDVHDVAGFFRHVLERTDWSRDLHFHTRTTIDTLDYSGTSLNEGSKVVIAAAGPKRRALMAAIPADLRLPAGFSSPRVVLPGILAIQGPPCQTSRGNSDAVIESFCGAFRNGDQIKGFHLLIIVDDSDFTAQAIDNFLWVTFTRADPAVDLYGVDSFVECKHWGCRGPLVIDARLKTHHAPPLEDDPEVEKKVDALGAPGGPLHGII